MITDLYHGSGNRFDKFNLNRFNKECYVGRAIYLTDNMNTAKNYTKRDFDRAFTGRYRDKYATVYNCNLNSDNVIDYNHSIVCFDYCPKRRINHNALIKRVTPHFEMYGGKPQEVIDYLYDGTTLKSLVSRLCACRSVVGAIAKFLGYDCISVYATAIWPTLFPEPETHYMVVNSKAVEITESMPLYLAANR